MSETQFQSSIRPVPHSVETVYPKLADLTTMGRLREIMDDPESAEKLKERIPADKLEEAKRALSEMSFGVDFMTFVSPMGSVTLRIVERDAPRSIKFTVEGAPFPAQIVIQLTPDTDNSCQLRVILHAELNVFIKGMVSGPIEKGIDKIAEVLASLPYNL